jgi:hypothetical protein
MMQSSLRLQYCPFCLESRDPRSCREFLGAAWPYPHRTLLALESVFVVPGYGPQVHPYFMVVTRRHILSAREATLDEVRDVVRALEWILLQNSIRGSSLTFFEHSACPSEGSCIEHFHVHVIDGAVGLETTTGCNNEAQVTVRQSGASLPAEPYVWIGSYSGGSTLEGLVAPKPRNVEQCFRRRLANHLRQDAWDWRLGMNRSYMTRLIGDSGLARGV